MRAPVHRESRTRAAQPGRAASVCAADVPLRSVLPGGEQKHSADKGLFRSCGCQLYLHRTTAVR